MSSFSLASGESGLWSGPTEKSRGGVGDNTLASDLLAEGVPEGVVGTECAQCGHRWQGYTQWKGRSRRDGSRPKTEYYSCGGYIK